MKYTRFAYYVAIIWVMFLLGCIPVPNSPSARFYSLQPISVDSAAQTFEVSSDKIIAVGPIRIPEYLNRPQIVTKDRKGMLTFAQFDRWGEPLDLAFVRLISTNLRAMLPGINTELYPWNLAIPVKYQVLADVTQLEAELDGELFLAVQWSIIDVQNNKMLLTRRSEFSNPINPHNYSGLVKTLSSAFSSLSVDMAKAIDSLAKK